MNDSMKKFSQFSDPSGSGSPTKVVILGGGPAGLTAGWELARRGIEVEILEANTERVGGIACTVAYKGFHFDMGGHRFFTKSQEISDLFHRLLSSENWLRVPRLSRIYYQGKFFQYPLKAFDALSKLGLWETTKCIASYGKAKFFP